MDGFKQIFDNCENLYNSSKVNFYRFREQEDIYGFLLTNGPLDMGSLQKAHEIDPELFSEYLNVRKSQLGYGDRITYKFMDQCDSRHIMMSTMIFSKLKSIQNIVEIGGGYGNWFRLNRNIVDFEKWIIIDLPYCLDLQQWYLEREIGSLDKLDFRSAYDYTVNEFIDLVIGTHSVSELAWNDFLKYYEKILLKTKYFFYAGHKWNCGEDLLNLKLEKLDNDFDLIDSYLEADGLVYNNLYVRKNVSV